MPLIQHLRPKYQVKDLQETEIIPIFAKRKPNFYGMQHYFILITLAFLVACKNAVPTDETSVQSAKEATIEIQKAPQSQQAASEHNEPYTVEFQADVYEFASSKNQSVIDKAVNKNFAEANAYQISATDENIVLQTVNYEYGFYNDNFVKKVLGVCHIQGKMCFITDAKVLEMLFAPEHSNKQEISFTCPPEMCKCAEYQYIFNINPNKELKFQSPKP